jgi:hypothetical protein
MSFKVYYEYAKGCVARSIAFSLRTSKTSNVRSIAVYYDYLKVQHGRGNVFLVVRGCLKGLLGGFWAWEKSMLFRLSNLDRGGCRCRTVDFCRF